MHATSTIVKGCRGDRYSTMRKAPISTEYRSVVKMSTAPKRDQETKIHPRNNKYPLIYSPKQKLTSESETLQKTWSEPVQKLSWLICIFICQAKETIKKRKKENQQSMNDFIIMVCERKEVPLNIRIWQGGTATKLRRVGSIYAIVPLAVHSGAWKRKNNG